MPTTYAAYYNLVQADKAARQMESRRTSADTQASSEAKASKTGLKRFLDALRPTEEDIKPSGIYTPIIKQGPLFAGLKPAEQAQRPSPIYQRERPLFSFSSSSGKKRGSQSSVSSTSS